MSTNGKRNWGVEISVTENTVFIEKNYFKEHIHYIDYNPILYGLNMIVLPANIDKARIKNRKIGEEMDRKHKLQTVSNTSINLDYM